MIFDQIVLSGSDDIKLFDLTDPLSTPYTTQTIDGLGPTDVDVMLSQTTEGQGIYVGRRGQLREIVLTILLNPDYTKGETPESLRESLYLLRAVNEDASLDFILKSEGVEQAITPVYIKRTEMSVFSQESKLVLTLASTSEHFYRRDPLTVDISFEDQESPTLLNEGSVNTGFRISLKATAPLVKLQITTAAPTRQLVLTTELTSDEVLCLINDTLIIESTLGKRGIWKIKDGESTTTSLLSALTADSSWLQLQPGTNIIEVYAWTSFDHSPANAFVWDELTYRPLYQGV